MAQALPDKADALLSMTFDGQEGVLVPIRATVREKLSEPYEIELTAIHGREEEFKPEEILQKKVRLTLRHREEERVFHGLIREYQPLGQMRGFRTGSLKIVPAMWALTLATDCRIFQEQTADDIIKEIFAHAGLQSPDFKLTGPRVQLPYRTQYNESGLRFCTRLMEEAGWFYFIEQGERSEKVIVTDDNASLISLGTAPANELFERMRPAVGIARGKERTADYNPETPRTEVKGEQATVLKAAGPLSPEAFVWPARSAKPDEAAQRARLKMEAAEAASHTFTGDGGWVKLSPGHFFELADTPFTQAFEVPPGKYAVRSVVHQATDERWVTGGAAPSYSSSFEVFPIATPWREPMETRKPRMDGVHSAVVIGGDSDVVFTDDLGRVKIRFFWDHRGDASADNGIWARVVQPWAGNGWGGHFIPRVGTEVAVAFMNGDPDYPVVLGGLYNGVDAPIFTKAENTRSGFRTRSFAGSSGGNEEFSEFSFDDKQGEEQVFLHAQKDYKVNVENDLNLKVENCRVVQIVNDDSVKITGKQDYEVKGNQSLKITDGDRKVVLNKGNHATKLDMGNYKLTTAMGKVEIEAMQSITLKVGSNTLVIDQTGVKIDGMQLKFKGTMTSEMEGGLTLKLKGGMQTDIEGGMMTNIKAGLMTSVKGVMTDVKGDGMLVLKGGLTMIN